MLKAYDIAVKNLIEVFAPNIRVVGLQNEDTTDTGEMAMAQAAKDSQKDQVSLPVISVFRNPTVMISDGSMTKRASTADGYSWLDSTGNRVISLVAMRSTLTYTVDVFDVTREAAETIALGLFFRLRNNPQIKATFNFEGLDKPIEADPEIELKSEITNIRVNDKNKSQLYKVRFSFDLVNANIYDILDREAIKYVEYSIKVSLNVKSSLSIESQIQ